MIFLSVLSVFLTLSSATNWSFAEWNHYANAPEFHLPFSTTGFFVGSWNTGLFPGVDPAHIITAIPRSYSVIGLQEVWDESTAQFLANALAQWYPFAYFVPAVTTNDIGCIAVASRKVCRAALGYETDDCVPFLAGGLLGCLIDSGFALDKVSVAQVLASPCGGLAGALLSVDSMVSFVT